MLADLFFYQGTDFYSRMIAWATHGPYSHVAIDCGDGTMIAATTKGVVRSPISYENMMRLFTSKYTPDKSSGFIWLQRQLGAPYDFYDVVLAVVFSIFPAVARAVPYIPDDHYICSELAAWFLRASGFPFPATQDTDTYFQTLSPNSLYQLVQEHST